MSWKRALTACAVGLCAAACGDGGGFPDAHLVDAASRVPGTFAVSWTIADGSGSAVTCDEAAATTVQVVIVDATTGAQSSIPFPCDLDSGVSGAEFPSTYNLSFALLGSGSSAPIATAATQMGAVIMSDKTTMLPVAAFVVASP